VEVRPLNDILATLDARGCLDALPFMPEMAAFCGKRLKIFKAVHKTCDPTGMSDLRRMEDTVHLEARCDGASHGGCQAGCLFFWKTAWLKPADASATPLPVPPKEPAVTMAMLERATRIESETGADIHYRCQATEIVRASTPLSPLAPWQYVADLRSRNVTPAQFVKFSIIAILRTVLITLRALKAKLRGGAPASPESNATPPTSGAALNLQPGEVVEIRSRDEILPTLNKDRKNRGLSFDADMALFCGSKHKVLARVERIIDEKTGKMIKINRDCIVMEDVICTGLDCRQRLFCTRGVYTYWREAWLKRAEPVAQADTVVEERKVS
jgi:hypothetical protein